MAAAPRRGLIENLRPFRILMEKWKMEQTSGW